MNPKEVKKFLDSDAGQAMKDFLLEELMELRKIDNLREYSTPTAQTIEIKSQKKAFNKLRDILEKLMTINDYNSSEKAKDQYFSM